MATSNARAARIEARLDAMSVHLGMIDGGTEIEYVARAALPLHVCAGIGEPWWAWDGEGLAEWCCVACLNEGVMGLPWSYHAPDCAAAALDAALDALGASDG